MTTLRRVSFIVLLLLLTSFQHSQGANILCTACGMPVDLQSPFSAQILQGEKVLHFCDIGDLLSYVKRKKPGDVTIQVKDYATGAWIDARKAYYVHSGSKYKTPMGWGIAAFSEKNEASKTGTPRDFDTMIKDLQ